MAATSKQRKLNVGIQHPLAVCITDIHSNAYITEIQHGDPAFTGTGATWLHPGGRYLRPTCTFFGFPSNSGRQTERPRSPTLPHRWQGEPGGLPLAPLPFPAAALARRRRSTRTVHRGRRAPARRAPRRAPRRTHPHRGSRTACGTSKARVRSQRPVCGAQARAGVSPPARSPRAVRAPALI